MRPTACILLLVVASCDPGTAPALLVRLQPDLTRQSEEAVSRALAHVRLSVDVADPGIELAGLPPGEGTDEVAYVDLDDDGAREPVYELAWQGFDRLPTIGIGTEQNGDRAVKLRAEGEDGEGNLVALGGLDDVVVAGQVETVMSFNLLPSRLPPRVVDSSPQAGREIEGLGAVAVTFSRRVQPSSLAGSLHLECTGSTIEPTAIEVKTEVFSNPALSRDRVFGSLPPDQGGTCAIVVEPGVLADDGTPFDQDAFHQGADRFVSGTFTVLPVPAGPPLPGCPDGLVPGPDGSCVPADGCGTCETGLVCDDLVGRCVEDCRTFGACIDPARQCGSSGLCSSSG